MRPAQLGVGPERPLNGYGTASTQGASRVSRAGRTPPDLPPLPSALLQPGSPLNAPGRGTQPLSCSRSGRPPGGGFWARAGCRACQAQGTLPLYRLPKLGPCARPAACPRAQATSPATRSDVHWDGHLSIRPRDRDPVEIKHLSPPESVTQVFPNSLPSPSREACPPSRPIIREKNNAVSITHTLSTEALSICSDDIAGARLCE